MRDRKIISLGLWYDDHSLIFVRVSLLGWIFNVLCIHEGMKR